MRVRITFAKTEAMRFTGHLDLFRTWERTIRRAHLPLAYSQGYRPHPHLVLASALPLGCTSEHELLDIWLGERLPPDEIEAILNRAVPPGIQLVHVVEVDDKEPSLPVQVIAAEFQIRFGCHVPGLEQRIQELLNSREISRSWRDKPYDLRPLILDLRCLPPTEAGQQQILVRLSARENATGRPEEIIRALGSQPEESFIHRTGLILQKD
jgi:radical SAM-linked protein